MILRKIQNVPPHGELAGPSLTAESRFSSRSAQASSTAAQLHRPGNQAMLRLLGSGVLQKKLTVSAPEDVYEQEADRVADAVMHMPDSAETPASVGVESPSSGASLQRCPCGASSPTGGDCEECKSSVVKLQRISNLASPRTEAPPIVHEVLGSPGQPLDRVTRSLMEPRFGADFSGVRVHTDAKAAESARAVNALAYTVGNHLVLGERQYRPNDRYGRSLLAHELTHVLQQRGAPVRHVIDGARLRLARAAGLQRFTCDHGTGPTMSCTDAQGATRPSGFEVDRFETNKSTVTATQRTQIAAFKAAWDAAGSADDAEVHGYASCDGVADANVQLSCDRAEAVKAELVRMGVGTTIQTFAHGETDEFGPSLLDNHKVIIKLVTQPLQTVTIPHIRGTATPAAMAADRIPPRVDTPVTIVIGGTPNLAAPVTLSIDGGGGTNGSATINGGPTQSFAASGPQTVNLRGVTQTAPGSAGHLTLVARQRGAVLASSSGFSVSSIPQNLSFTFNRLETVADCTALGLTGCLGIVVDYAWQSDSTVQADLDRALQSERIETITAVGLFAGGRSITGCYLSSISPQQDIHGAGGLAGVTTAGVSIVKQAFMFRDDRTGARDIPMTNSGFLVSQVVSAIPGTGFMGFFQEFQLTSTKVAAATSVTDPNPACPSGTISTGAGTGFTTKTQHT